MRALSIRQPWAWAIIYGGKDIENRTWRTNFRGRFLVHASQRYDHEGEEWILRNFPELERVMPAAAVMPRGGIIGSVELVDCVVVSRSLWFFGQPWGFALRDPRPMKFRPLRGRLMFFEVK